MSFFERVVIVSTFVVAGIGCQVFRWYNRVVGRKLPLIRVIGVCFGAVIVVILSVPVGVFVFAAVGIVVVVGVCFPCRRCCVWFGWDWDAWW